MGKIIIFSAPSGSGKSTIINEIFKANSQLTFSISATSRSPRGTEKNGVEYYFLTPEEFRQKIDNQEFVEYEEVYPGCFYGTLKSELARAESEGKTLIFDIDVKGGMNLKRIFGEQALAIFIQPPSIAELKKRLISRATDSAEMIEKRVGKAEFELQFAKNFDTIIINDDLEKAKNETLNLVQDFLK